MGKGRLFRRANVFLLLAAGLSAALLVAPIAYASNFAAKVHASVYGTWVVIDRDMGNGVDFVSTRYLWELPLHWPYALVGVLLTFTLLRALFTNKNDYNKLHRARRGFWLAVLYGFTGVIIRYFALYNVGRDAAAEQLEAGFQREMLFIFFILYFIFRAQGKILPHSGLLTHRGESKSAEVPRPGPDGDDSSVVV